MKKYALICLLLALTLALGAALADGSAGGYETGDYLGVSSIGTKQAVVISKSATLRSRASAGSSSLGSLSNGQRVDVLDDTDRNWLYVRATVKKGTAEGWVQRIYLVVEPLTLTLRRSNTPAYSAPSRTSKRVGSLPSYTALDVIGTYDDFYIVNLRQASAFIAMDADVWTSRDIASLFAQSGQAKTRRKTKTRTGPGENWPEGETIASGKSVEFGWEEDGWTPIRWDDKVAYVDADDLEIVSPIVRTAAQPTATAQPAQAGQTITLPTSGGVTLVYWATPDPYGSETPAANAISLTQAAEAAVKAITYRYGVQRRQLAGYELRYSFHSSARRAFGVDAPYWTLYFWGGDDVGVVWMANINAASGAVLEVSGADDGNG